MKKLAVCVATIGHPDIVRDVLQKCAQDYYRYGIDIYYYDSSEDGQTKDVVEEFIGQGYNNLYYLHVDMDFEDKISTIIRGEGLKEEYEYLWPVKDRSFCPAGTLDKIMQVMEEAYDLIMLGVIGRSTLQTYEVAEEFYRDWGWLATSLDVLIYRYATMLDPCVWKPEEDIPHTEYTPSWRMYATVFTRLDKMQTMWIKVLMGADIKVINSPLGTSLWNKNTFFKIWKDQWIQVNECLPECYTPYKGSVIKTAASLPWIFGGVSRLKELHKLGALTVERLEEVEKDWEKVSDYPIEYLRQIAADCDEEEYFSVKALEKTGNDIVDILIEMCALISEGKLSKDQIPTQDILQCVLNTYSQTHDDSLRREVFAESVKDILLHISKNNTSTEEVRGCLQILINFLLLMMEETQE